MNRADRRKLMKKAKSSGVSKDSVLAYLAASEIGINIEDVSFENKIQDGDLVRINVEKIKARDGYKNMSEGYKEFVEGNSDTIFTAKPKTNTMVSFAEDSTWLFWNGDLIVENNRSEGS